MHDLSSPSNLLNPLHSLNPLWHIYDGGAGPTVVIADGWELWSLMGALGFVGLCLMYFWLLDRHRRRSRG